MKDIGFYTADFSDKEWKKVGKIWDAVVTRNDDYRALFKLHQVEDNAYLDSDVGYDFKNKLEESVSKGAKFFTDTQLFIKAPTASCSDLVLNKKLSDWKWLDGDAFVVYKTHSEYAGYIFICFLHLVQQLVPHTIGEMFEWNEESFEIEVPYRLVRLTKQILAELSKTEL